jgi:hypothetical protein
MAQNRWHVDRYCIWAVIMTSLPLHFHPGQPATDTAFAAEAAQARSGAIIINPNNPASATSFTWGGSNWQFQCVHQIEMSPVLPFRNVTPRRLEAGGGRARSLCAAQRPTADRGTDARNRTGCFTERACPLGS